MANWHTDIQRRDEAAYIFSGKKLWITKKININKRSFENAVMMV